MEEADALTVIKDLADALEGLRLGRGNYACWCQMAIGNPMFGRHSTACLDAMMTLGNARCILNGEKSKDPGINPQNP